jgi:peptidoglycan biosynthesis protein MviN/MurJ (putative lipid II flippase)
LEAFEKVPEYARVEEEREKRSKVTMCKSSLSFILGFLFLFSVLILAGKNKEVDRLVVGYISDQTRKNVGSCRI